MMNFNYEELIGKINGINIVLEGNNVVTYYNDKVKSRKPISKKYEVFDFKPFVIKCINEIIDKYEIEKYSLSIVGGRQEIQLVSYPEIIKGETFKRAFYLLNSSDKSRALSFSYGLKHNNFQYISTKGTIYKKHYTGITKFVKDIVDLDDTIFQEQLELMGKIIGDSILMSNIQKIVTGSEVLKTSKISLKNNFERLKSRLYSATKNLNMISESDRYKLRVSWVNRETPPDFTLPENDFMIDSFVVFKTYLEMFDTRDASFIKRESERISGLSVLTNRNNIIDNLMEELLGV